jgi:hypothetical protein
MEKREICVPARNQTPVSSPLPVTLLIELSWLSCFGIRKKVERQTLESVKTAPQNKQFNKRANIPSLCISLHIWPGVAIQIYPGLENLH